jgi:hypothetical protein
MYRISMRILIFVLFLFTSLSRAEGQNQQEAILLYNLGFGGFSAGIGSVINKDKKTNWKKAFFRGFWQGTIGGGINYRAKKMLFAITNNNNLLSSFPAFLMHSAGTSLIENGAYGHDFGESWRLEYGPLRLDYSKKEKKVTTRLLPIFFFATAFGFQNSRLDAISSLLTGRMIFRSKDSLVYYNGKTANGVSFSRSLIYGNQPNKYKVIAHELTHQFQYSEYLVFNAWLKPSISQINLPEKLKGFQRFIYPEVPYFFGAYGISKQLTSPRYFGNYYEFEAEAISTNRFVNRR